MNSSTELISYAQNFEDVMLWRALGHITNGRYIDLGAHDPVRDSVSLTFYERGWRGVHVDAASYCVEKLRQARPDEIVLHAAVTDQDGFVEFYSFKQDNIELGISSCSSINADEYIRGGRLAEKVVVQSITLDGIFRCIGLGEVHWLKIDVEGSELNVLKGWEKESIRPWIIVVESTRPLSNETNHYEWEPLLINKGYKHVYFDGLNRYYVSVEHEELIPAFSYPPCVFDDFALYGGASHAWARNFNRSLNQLRQLQESTSNEVARQKLIIERMEKGIAELRAQNEMDIDNLKLENVLMEKQAANRKIADEIIITDLKVQMECLKSSSINEAQNYVIEITNLKSKINELTQEKEDKQEINSREILRLRSLVYSVKIWNHLYRALRVLMNDPHYTQKKHELVR